MNVALVPASTFEEPSVRLSPGDVLVAYSDGITEMMNAERDFFGEERLRHLLTAQRDREAAVIGRTVVDAVTAFAGGTPAHDDVSLVIARRLSS